MKKILPYIIPILLLVSMTSMTRFFPDTIEASRLRVFDFYQSLKPRPYEQTPVRIIDFDDTTLEKYGQWPWPRTLIAELITKLKESGAKVIAFDILFSEKDRSSPEMMLALWEKASPSLLPTLDSANWPNHDQIFAEAISTAPVITAFTLTPKPNDIVPASKSGFGFSGEDPRAYMSDFPGAIKTLSELENVAQGNGIIFYIPEFDGVIRRIGSVFQLRGALYPSLATETLRLYEGAQNILIKTSTGSGIESYGEKTGFVSIKVGRHIIPTDKNGRLWLYDTGPIPERTLPVWQILEGLTSPNELKDSIALIGTSAAGLKDLRATPLDPGAAGVGVHAQLLEQILLKQYLNRPDWAEGAELTFLVIISVLLIFLIPKLGAAWSAILALFAIFSSFYFSWQTFANDHLLFDPLLPFGAILLVYVVSSIIHFLKTDAEKRQIRGAFGRYLSPSIVEKLARNPEQLKLGGELKEMTFLFADICGFTTISEQFDAHGLTQFINRFLTPMTNIILEQQGTIDKYMGDCIMAFWNAPLDDLNHHQNACLAALAMQNYLDKWNLTLEKEAKENNSKFIPIQIGIGINTGECCVGNMGSDQRFDYSVLGDSVNLASRLEGLSRVYGARIIIGEETNAKITGFETLELDLVQVKGKTEPSRIYALLGRKNLALNEDLKKHHQIFLENYRLQNWSKADDALKVLSRIDLNLKNFNLTIYCRLFGGRIALFKEETPDRNWSGVWEVFDK